MTERERIQAAIRGQPDLKLKELKARLGTRLSVQTMCRALQQLRLSIKKALKAAEQLSPDVDQQRFVMAFAAGGTGSGKAGVSG
ncbi:MAG: hypothetical protein DWH81_05155 [Planctomycetota bacterium]|nr:MAG: hypothetical protein DWH81_05155 [Planctomycetota bacterium]